MIATESTLPPSVLPWIVDSVVPVIAARVVTDPVHAIDMRIVGVPAMILEVPALVILMGMSVIFPWTLRWGCARVLAINAIAMIVVLREAR
jgi:hypothetical protein